MTTSWASISSRRDSPSTSRGTSQRRKPTSIRCCCISPISISIASRWSSSRTSCWPCSCVSDAFTPEQRARNFEYYERITVRDSSLSACTEAVAAADAGHLRLAFDYAAEAALMDLHDFEHNARDGLHVASLAGTWIAFVIGFGGMRDHGDILAFAPRLPDGLTRLEFSILYRGHRLSVEVTTGATKYALSKGEGPIRILHHGETLTLTGSEPIIRPIPQAPERSEPSQPPGRAPRRRLAA